MGKRKIGYIIGAISGALAGVLGAWVRETFGAHPVLIGVSAAVVGVIIALIVLGLVRGRRMRQRLIGFLRNLGRIIRIGVTAYITAGIAYWITREIFLRYIGKEITFSPLVSVLLVVPVWPLHIYGNWKWISVLPQDIVALFVVSTSVLFLLRKYG